MKNDALESLDVIECEKNDFKRYKRNLRSGFEISCTIHHFDVNYGKYKAILHRKNMNYRISILSTEVKKILVDMKKIFL